VTGLEHSIHPDTLNNHLFVHCRKISNCSAEKVLNIAPLLHSSSSFVNGTNLKDYRDLPAIVIHSEESFIPARSLSADWLPGGLGVSDRPVVCCCLFIHTVFTLARV